MNLTELREILPALVALDETPPSIRPASHLIIAAGFEDRNMGFLNKFRRLQTRSTGAFKGASVINYVPPGRRNTNRTKIKKALLGLGVTPSDYDFDTEHPADFSETVEHIFDTIGAVRHVYLDISVMSKLLILYMLNALWSRDIPFSVVYSEARKYRPSLQEYGKSLRKGHFGQDILMEFLFSGVFEPLIPQPFAGRAPVGRARALVTFLGFNKRQAIGAASIIPYQWFVPVVGIPPNRRWRWRIGALIQINNYGLLASGQKISDLPQLKPDYECARIAQKGEYRLHVSTFDYVETVQTLLWIAGVHRYSHFLTIAPFGSKLQALGTFLFTRIHPETQIVYASPKDFHPRYSEGVKAVYEIPFLKPKQLEERLMVEANPNFAVLEKLITADSAAAT